ncbi:glycosyltransferase [Pectobacterium polaris]|uniref:glycosyltransferase n=1 Tax=Pectobacterium polaris TaxID=2042057 RepID=UPI000BB3DF9D|nr:glycosyltransferase [Pectobacterium polaris]ASY76563.1 hypothetical protein BJJ97_11875 [Pectobacterium polaris]
MKKIIFYLNSMQPAGGIERVVSTLVNKLNKVSDVSILVKDKPTSFYKLHPDIPFQSLGINLVLNMKSRLIRAVQVLIGVAHARNKIRTYFKNNTCDFFCITAPINLLELMLAGVSLKKIIITEHGAADNYNFFYKAIKFLFYKKSHKLIVPTKTDAAVYKKQFFPVKYIPHFKPDMEYSRSDLSSRVVLNIGRFTEDKQQLQLMKIWHDLIKENSIPDGWILRILGGGELENEIREFISENKISSIELKLPRADIDNEYKGASLFALSSKSEGFGMVLLEAISFGLPCIAYDCNSGPRDILINKENGFLIPLNNKEEYKDKLKLLLNNSSLLQNMGNAAYISSLSWNDERIINGWLEVINE